MDCRRHQDLRERARADRAELTRANSPDPADVSQPLHRAVGAATSTRGSSPTAAPDLNASKSGGRGRGGPADPMNETP
ncbi:hypothetical protein DJ77_05320 [Halorubrum ezzemoulense]|nr:hypothetical protein DJ77_05320 [Halorubrum ezzemoulense]